MSFQLGDWGLKLLVALSLILGMSPDVFAQEESGCFKCDGGPQCDNPSINTTVVCSDITYLPKACFKTGVAGAMKRGCYSMNKAQCIRKWLDERLCYNAIVHKEITGDIEDCIRYWKESPDDLKLYEEATLCVCVDKSNCNDGPTEAAIYINRTTTTTTTEPGRGYYFQCDNAAGSGGKTNSAGQSTSNFKLIYGVLTIAAIYNYSSGSTSF